MSTKWTEDQRKVIDARDQNLLVSAAAGSGKTAVLVERILSLITDPDRRVDVDRLLVTTFTKAAASQMRERIGKALGEQIQREPGNEWLERQEALLNRAQITTIHGFCLYVIRNYFHTIGLNPSFRIMDEGELRMMEQDVAQEIIEEAHAEGAPGFLRFVESYGSGNRGSGLEEMVLKLYEYAAASPQPEKWLKECAARYELAEDAGWEAFAGTEALFTEMKATVSDCIRQIQKARKLSSLPGGPFPYDGALGADEELLSSLLACGSMEGFGELLQSRCFQRLPSRRSKAMAGVDEELCTRIMELRSGVKDTLKSLEKQYFQISAQEALSQVRGTAGNVECYVELTLKFMERFTEQKRKKNLLDFSDQEHLALQILTREVDGRLVPSQVAEVFADYFVEIMVDEYQDSNQVQEAILESISGQQKGRDNRFMVGDVKQSIYRFRQAEPGLFLEKYQSYGDGRQGIRIDLHQNFRSRNEVLLAVNEVFERIMCQELGGIEYDEAAALKPGASYPEEGGCRAELLLLTEEEWEELRHECRWTKPEAEAHLVAERIRRLMKDGRVTEQGALRPVRPGDIVILLRTMAGWSETFVRVLQEEGIPASAQSRTGYFQTMEIEGVLSYLRVLDNPLQEIPLAASLHGQFGRFSSEELAKLKAAYPELSFVEACRQYAADGPEEGLRARVASFFEKVEDYRRRSAYTPIHELLWQILTESGFLDEVRALPGGEQRLANVEMLLQKAQDYEKMSYHGLFHFIRYIEKLQSYSMDYGEADLAGKSGDAVQIMSIHHSKGLEFPVVFVSGVGKSFNRQEGRDKVVLHSRYGIGLDYVDLEARRKRPTLWKQLIRRQNLLDGLAEELRILYVAMTRAKEKLILTGMGKKKLLDAGPAEEGKLLFLELSRAGCSLDWILPALKAERSSLEKIRVPFADVVESAVKERVQSALSREELEKVVLFHARDERLRKEIDQRLSWEYPFNLSKAGKQKYSVTELKKLWMPEEPDTSEELYPKKDLVPLVPQFIEKTEEKKGAARGTLYHTVMECLDFEGITRISQIKEGLKELVREGRLLEEDLRSIRAKDFLPYIKSGLSARMAEAGKRGELYREQPFVIGLPGDQVDGSDSEELVLVQGIIDAFFYEEDRIVVVDYKTDYILREEEFVEKYRAQLDYYGRALEMLTGGKVKERLIYSFVLGKVIEV